MQDLKNRFQKRKEQTHSAILGAAMSLIEQKGSDCVSMDLIADTADISRATLFNHFQNKNDLLVEVFGPLFDDSLSIIKETMLHIQSKEIDALEGIKKVCLYLWDTKRSIINGEKSSGAIYTSERLLNKHKDLVAAFEVLFMELSTVHTLRLPSYKQAAQMVYRTFIPILDSLEGTPAREDIFLDCIRGLLLSDAGEGYHFL